MKVKKAKRYYYLKQFVAEFKLAIQLHQNGIVDSLNECGYRIVPYAEGGQTRFGYNDPIDLNYNEVEWDYQHCKNCKSDAVLRSRFGISLVK